MTPWILSQNIKITLMEGLALNFITWSTHDFLNEFPRIPIFYTLLKVQKPDRPPKGCPIISSCNGLLDPL